MAQDMPCRVMRRFVDAKMDTFPHLLLYGPPGTGKTTAALACARALYGDADYPYMVLSINASDDRGIGTVRDTIVGFVHTRAVTGARAPKLVLLDEVDAMTPDAQCALRLVIEDNTALARFVLLCNDITKLLDALRSRCVKLRFRPLRVTPCQEFLTKVAVTENAAFDPEAIRTIVQMCRGDMRRAVNLMQNLAAGRTETGKGSETKITAADVLAFTGAPAEADIDALVALLRGSSGTGTATETGTSYAAVYHAVCGFLADKRLRLADVLDAVAAKCLHCPAILAALCDSQWRLVNSATSEAMEVAAVVAAFAV